MSVTRLTYKLGDADLILETGKIGKQANGCVYAQWGGAAVIATICASSSVTEGQDFVPVTVEYSTTDASKVKSGDSLKLIIKFEIMENVQCFTGETLVTLADGSTKQIKDVTYDDLLMVYDFDRGEFSVSYPIWIAKVGEYNHYYKMTFSDNSYVNIVLSHRLFTLTDMDFEKLMCM